MYLFRLFLFIHPRKDIARLTVQLPANDLKHAEADGFGYAVFSMVRLAGVMHPLFRKRK